MGKLERMAVYTDVSFEDLEAILGDYDIGTPLSFKGIAEGVENSNFHLQTDRGAFILTLYEKRVRESDLPFFLGLMEHLAGHRIACPQPIRRRDGAQWTTINGRPAALLSFLSGLSLRRPDASQCAAAGDALADFTPPDGTSPSRDRTPSASMDGRNSSKGPRRMRTRSSRACAP